MGLVGGEEMKYLDRWRTRDAVMMSTCLLFPVIVCADPPTTVVTTILGKTQSVSQICLSERWSLHPLPKIRERNLEQAISVRFLDPARALVSLYSKAWEQTMIVGHKDSARLYCFNEEATYIVPVADVFDILSEEVVYRREKKDGDVTYWNADIMVIIPAATDNRNVEFRSLDFEVSLTRIMLRLAKKGVLQNSEKEVSLDESGASATRLGSNAKMECAGKDELGALKTAFAHHHEGPAP
jgi:hypothetical protein